MKMRQDWRSREGNAAVEFALAFMVLITMGVGAVDFGRLFFDSIAMQGAASSGTQYAISTLMASSDLSHAETAGNRALDDVDGATVTIDQFCDCPDNPGVAVSCSTARCSGYGLSRYYVRSRVTGEFSTIIDYPLVPSSTGVDLSNWLRVR